MKRFDGRLAAITGAGSGIGRALAIELAKRGARLALSDVDAEGLAETAAMVDVPVSTASVDVADRAAVEAWADRVNREQGGAQLIFNNAGVALVGTLDEVTYDDFHWLMNINFWGVVHGTTAFLPQLKRSDEGHIVNISSVFGIIAAPLNGTYNAAKFAVRGYTEALRIELELAELPIGVTCVHPGGIATNISRKSRVAGDYNRDRIAEVFDRMARTSPESCAKTILAAVRDNAPRVLVGMDARLIDTVQRLVPTGYQRILSLGRSRLDEIKRS